MRSRAGGAMGKLKFEIDRSSKASLAAWSKSLLAYTIMIYGA